MKRLGVIEDVSYRGMFIVRPGYTPHRGAMVVDRRNREIGRVSGILGPVAKPFVLIEPLRHGGKGFAGVGAAVYLR